MFKLLRTVITTGRKITERFPYQQTLFNPTRFKNVKTPNNNNNSNRSLLGKFALAAVLGGSIGYYLSTNNEKKQLKLEQAKDKQKQIDPAAQKTSSTATQATSNTGDKAQQIKDKSSEKAQDVKENVNKAGEKLSQKAADVKDKASDKVGDAKNKASENAAEAKDKASDKAKDAKSYASEKANDVKEGANKAGEKISEKASEIKNKASEKAGQVKDKLSQKAYDAHEELETNKDAEEIARETAGHDLGAGRGYYSEASRANSGKTEGTSQSLLDTASKKVGEIEQSALEGSRKLGKMVSDKASEKASDLKDAVAGKASDLKEVVKDTAAQAAEKAKGLAQQASHKVVDKATDLKDAVAGKASEKASDLKEAVAGKASDLKDAAKDSAGQAAEKAKGLAQQASSRVADAVKSTAVALTPFGKDNSPKTTELDPDVLPGESTSLKNRLLEKGADLMQSFKPLSGIHQHLCGFHFYSGRMNEQVNAHHYCTHLNNDVMQCIIYDSDSSDARLIGIEYVITERIFQLLPEEEQVFWHSHAYEVKSGQLVGPGLPAVAEKEAMKELVNTYGKTFHTWQVDKDHFLPLGIPQLMMAFTKDGQLDDKLCEKRNKELGIDQNEIRKQREDIEVSKKEKSLADHWETIPARQLSVSTVEAK